MLPDPETGQPSDCEILPEGREYEFYLSPSSKKAQDLLEKIGDPNVRTLGEKCFRVLTDYYRYYQDQLATPKGSV